MIGAVAALRDQLAWAELRPLHGRRIVVTRARAQASGLVERLRDLGAEVDECAVIRIEPLAGPPIDAGAYGARLRHLAERAAAAAGALRRRRARARRRDGRGDRPGHRRGAARGRDRRRRRGRALRWRRGCWRRCRPTCAGVRALVARAEEARDTLPEGLRAAGAEVDVVPLYRTLAAQPRHPERMLAADAVAFTSSSTVTRFAEALAGHDLCGRARRLDRPRDECDGARARRRPDRGGERARPRRTGGDAAAGSVGTSRSLTAPPAGQPTDPPLA